MSVFDSGEVLPPLGLIARMQQFQDGLKLIPPQRQRDEAMRTINEELGDPRTIDGMKHVYLLGLCSFILAEPEPRSFDEEFFSGTYIPLGLFKATVDELSYVDTGEIRSICVGLIEVEIIKAPENDELVGQTIETGLYVPAQGVQTVVAA